MTITEQRKEPVPTKSISPRRKLICDWGGSVVASESTLHQLSPYIGKVKSSMAASLVSQFTREGDLIYDAFSGSGSVGLEAWAGKRRVIANDLSPYARLLTRAKLFPCRTIENALAQIRSVAAEADRLQPEIDLRHVPGWVRRFFHPETLRETLAWVTILRKRRNWFVLASLLGILHHQRPGFLSFPSSHTVPYLRVKKFPRSRFPEMYEYRSLRERLEAKVTRAFRRMPELDFNIKRTCFGRDARYLSPQSVDAIITSPPYMRLLDYARDNRLRLWFLGVSDWHSLDDRVSPSEDQFLELMRQCFTKWKSVLKPGHCCVLVVGDAFGQVAKGNLPEVVSEIATRDVGGYERLCMYTDPIPNERRVRRGIMGSSSETIVVLRTKPTRTTVRRQTDAATVQHKKL